MPPERFGAYLREFDGAAGPARSPRRSTYGHFGDGCLHVRIDFDLASRAGIANFRAFLEDAADLVVAHGGSLSGEHGDGSARAELLSRMYPPEASSVRGVSRPRSGPRRPVNPDRSSAGGRWTTTCASSSGFPRTRSPRAPRSRHDRGSFARATRRCLGVGKCVTAHGGVMCPSYRVTREEMHSTRGRARLLFEMANGQVVRDGWRSDEVREALDLCLSCKGCKRDCPVGVDMATYKTEFLASATAGGCGRCRTTRWVRCPAGCTWWAGSRRGRGRAERRGPGPAGGGGEAAGRDRPGARDPPDRPAPVHRPPVAPARAVTAGPPTPSPALARHLHQPLRPRRSPPTPSPCSRPSATPSSCRPAPSAAG